MGKYAIINSGARQFWVEENSVIEVEKLSTGDHKEITLDQVLLASEEGKTRVGNPFISNASVVCEVLGDEKQKKVINFKFKRRKGYKRKVGHRQVLTRLKVKSIQVGA